MSKQFDLGKTPGPCPVDAAEHAALEFAAIAAARRLIRAMERLMSHRAR
jgi:hypothetical protein